MKALKIILILVLGIGAMVAALGFLGDDTYRVERSVTIAAPIDDVWPSISTLGAMDKWSPWNELDPSMKKSMDGTDGQIGAIARWEGNNEVGKGEQRIDSVSRNSLVRTRLKFIEPMESESDIFLTLNPDGDGTKVTWAMEGEHNFMSRLWGRFMDMDAMLGKDFEKGLGKLKEQVEEAMAAKPSYAINSIDWPATLYVGKREVVSLADMKSVFEKGFGSGMAAIGKAKAEPSGPPSGVYFEWNEANQTADMIAAIPVPLTAKSKLKGVDLYESPASKALVIDYYGGYGGMMAPHMAMDEYIKAQGLTHHTNVIEEYITDPMAEPDSSKWLTRIIYLVK
ncbi:MAG TPA: SRPBCC family protein [Flavobacteriales bacterium]|nr:SRPBCC family protein [Flavobacteriales bacterium]